MLEPGLKNDYFRRVAMKRNFPTVGNAISFGFQKHTAGDHVILPHKKRAALACVTMIGM
jgi:hypothetical protein